MQNFLPIGSVVLLSQGSGRIMIIGRCQRDKSTGLEYDYIGCPFPEGIKSNDNVLCFNKESILMVFALGYQNQEELRLRLELDKLWGGKKQ